MDTIAAQFETCAWIIGANTRDISHEESLRAPGDAGNCMNWVLGHIVKIRNEILGLLGHAPLFPPEKFARYGMGTARLTDGAEALPFEEILHDYGALQEPLIAALKSATADALGQRVENSPTGNPDETVGSLVVMLAFHEAYHAGQTGLLRVLLGKPRQVP